MRALRNRQYAATVWQRLGFLPGEYKQTSSGAIWFHAVSVGEVIAIAPLVERMKAPVFVSAGTLAGYATARQKFGDRVFYAPVDYAFAVRRVLRSLRPSVLAVAETEIWPNLFRETKRTGCALLMVNGRISDRTARRYSALRPFFRCVLRLPDCILAQTAEARDRFIRAGAPETIVSVGGNLKYDAEPVPAGDVPFTDGAKIWIAASTSADSRIDEEDAVIAAFREMPGWKLIVAPRKPERFNEVARKLEAAQVPFVRRTRIGINGAENGADVLLLDTVGELGGMFAKADVVFVGGTLAERGGHNILEPAIFGKPIVIGPHMENFRDIAGDFRAARAFREVRDGSELRAAVLEAALDHEMGLRAKECAAAKRGAVAKAEAAINTLYSVAMPCRRRSLPAFLFLWPFSRIWKRGGERRRRKQMEEQKRLPVPVISIGNITAGGTGKTPLVLHIARHLRDRGYRPGVLTRGYGRNSPHRILTMAPGTAAGVTHTGDEPQVILRSGVAAVGIGADRYDVGALLRERLDCNIMVLDDGFQHLRLARDIDIVLIDALNPFGECELLPLGRLREPMESLGRASLFIVTRSDCVPDTAPIDRKLRQWNAHAPIFRSRVMPLEWVSAFSEERYPAESLPFERTVAFCGLGNAEAFWRTLRELDLAPLDQVEYSDHHQYTPREARRLGMLGRTLGAQALLTTEKDLVNLCDDTEEVIQPVKLFWLRIGVAIENEGEFLKLLAV